MHRGYTRDRLVRHCRKLRRVNREIGITTDLIVGFPGETEVDFQETRWLVSEIGFDNAFVFKYSPRKGTPAAKMPDPVPPEIIEERHGRLLDLVNEIGKDKYRRAVGSRVQILVEGPSRRNPAVSRAAPARTRSSCSKARGAIAASCWTCG